MTKKVLCEPLEGEQDVVFGGVRPVRQRRGQSGQKSKSASRSRKGRRKATKAPGGIHQRANKRMAW